MACGGYKEQRINDDIDEKNNIHDDIDESINIKIENEINHPWEELYVLSQSKLRGDADCCIVIKDIDIGVCGKYIDLVISELLNLYSKIVDIELNVIISASGSNPYYGLCKLREFKVFSLPSFQKINNDAKIDTNKQVFLLNNSRLDLIFSYFLIKPNVNNIFIFIVDNLYRYNKIVTDYVNMNIGKVILIITFNLKKEDNFGAINPKYTCYSCDKYFLREKYYFISSKKTIFNLYEPLKSSLTKCEISHNDRTPINLKVPADITLYSITSVLIDKLYHPISHRNNIIIDGFKFDVFKPFIELLMEELFDEHIVDGPLKIYFDAGTNKINNLSNESYTFFLPNISSLNTKNIIQSRIPNRSLEYINDLYILASQNRSRRVKYGENDIFILVAFNESTIKKYIKYLNCLDSQFIIISEDCYASTRYSDIQKPAIFVYPSNVCSEYSPHICMCNSKNFIHDHAVPNPLTYWQYIQNEFEERIYLKKSESIQPIIDDSTNTPQQSENCSSLEIIKLNLNMQYLPLFPKELSTKYYNSNELVIEMYRVMHQYVMNGNNIIIDGFAFKIIETLIELIIDCILEIPNLKETNIRVFIYIGCTNSTTSYKYKRFTFANQPIYFKLDKSKKLSEIPSCKRILCLDETYLKIIKNGQVLVTENDLFIIFENSLKRVISHIQSLLNTYSSNFILFTENCYSAACYKLINAIAPTVYLYPDTRATHSEPKICVSHSNLEEHLHPIAFSLPSINI